MRILHTSDWHLGRSFHGVGMLEHQAAYVDHLLEVVASESVDLVVVSGDVYDRGLPSVDTVELAHETLVRLRRAGVRTVLTSGNHDSARRLGFAAELIDDSGIHLRTDPGLLDTPVELHDEHGPVAVYGIPYLDPDTARRTWDLSARSHAAALAEATRRIRADLAGRPGTRSVLLAHAFVAGGEASDSERDISVGGISHVPSAHFDGFDYVALGHLHGRQTLTDRIRYSGSPLAYSFSEAGHTKGSWLVDLGTDTCTAELVPAPVPRPLARLRGRLEDLLADAAHSVHEGSWVQVTLTDAQRPLEAMERLRRRFPGTLALAFEPVGAQPGVRRRRVAGRDDHQVTLDFVEHVRGGPAGPEEAELLRAAVDECCTVAGADVIAR